MTQQQVEKYLWAAATLFYAAPLMQAITSSTISRCYFQAQHGQYGYYLRHHHDRSRSFEGCAGGFKGIGLSFFVPPAKAGGNSIE